MIFLIWICYWGSIVEGPAVQEVPRHYICNRFRHGLDKIQVFACMYQDHAWVKENKYLTLKILGIDTRVIQFFCIIILSLNVRVFQNKVKKKLE